MNDHILLRSTALAVLLSFPVSGTVLAQTHHDPGHAVPATSASAKQADGTVRKVDTATGNLTIAHGPLEGLGMPSMTMAFRVAERAMLENVKVGDKIRFVPAHVGGEMAVTSLQIVP